MTAIKVLIVEDEPLIARNIAMYLRNNDFEVSGIAYDPEEALFNSAANRPILPSSTSTWRANRMASNWRNTSTNTCSSPSYSSPLIPIRTPWNAPKKPTPSGFIVKPFNEQTLYATIEIALANHATQANRHVPELVLDKLNGHLLAPLTEREFEVIRLMYAGKTNQQIADDLYIAMNTLKKHINNAYFKLDVNSRTTAVALLRDLMVR